MHKSEAEKPDFGGRRRDLIHHYWIAALLFVGTQAGILLAAMGDGWLDLLGSILLAPGCLLLLGFVGRAFLCGSAPAKIARSRS